MKLIELINARRVIERFAKERLSAALAYKLAKFIRETSGDESFYVEKLGDIVRRYGKKDEKGNFIRDEKGGFSLIPETARQGMDEANELENMKIDAPKTYFYLEDLNELKLSVEEMLFLHVQIKEGD